MTLSVAVLKEHNYGEWRRAHSRGEVAGELGPYSIGLLEEHGVEPTYSDALSEPLWQSAPLRRGVGWVERRWPILAGARNLLANRRLVSRADVTLVMFENQGAIAALTRRYLHGSGFAPRKLAIVSCWMAHNAVNATSVRLGQYRAILRGTDCVFCFSRNQVGIYANTLGVSEERIAVVPFGIDYDFFAPRGPWRDGRYVLAVGRDHGRDHETLIKAVAGTEIETVVVSPRLEGPVPANVRHIDHAVSHTEYREMLAKARIVVVPTRELAYPGGQTVVLEAMAAARPVIVSDTAAIRDYVVPEETACIVPVGDHLALRAAIGQLNEDATMRAAMGERASVAVSERFTQRVMWCHIAKRLHSLVSSG